MRLLFLLPLTSALITGYLFQKTTQEIAYLTGTIALVSLIFSLLIAPWQVQLIIVVVAIVIARQGWRRLQDIEKVEESIKPDQVTTTSKKKEINKYRGVLYNLSPSRINMTPGNLEIKYRGNPLPSQQLEPFGVIHRQSNLKYRGVDIAPNNFQSSPQNLEPNSTDPVKS